MYWITLLMSYGVCPPKIPIEVFLLLALDNACIENTLLLFIFLLFDLDVTPSAGSIAIPLLYLIVFSIINKLSISINDI